MILRHRKFRVKEHWMINATIKICNSNLHCSCEVNIKVVEHSFQVPMPNSSLLLNYMCFGARFLQESGSEVLFSHLV